MLQGVEAEHRGPRYHRRSRGLGRDAEGVRRHRQEIAVAERAGARVEREFGVARDSLPPASVRNQGKVGGRAACSTTGGTAKDADEPGDAGPSTADERRGPDARRWSPPPGTGPAREGCNSWVRRPSRRGAPSTSRALHVARPVGPPPSPEQRSSSATASGARGQPNR